MPPSPSTRSAAAGAVPPDVEKQAGAGSTGGPGDQTESDKERDDASRSSREESSDEWQIEPEPEILDTETPGVAGAVNRVLSRISTKSSWNPGPPPDGGKEAWIACACGHLIIANTWGFINSFGVFQTYYATLLGRPPADISWIGSIQVFLTFFVGAFAGRVTDAGFFRPVLLLGTVLLVLGILTTSLATQYWHFVLAQGLCMGLGSGCLFTPTVSTVSTYFDRRRSLSMGLTASGSATGGLIFPAMARQLLPQVGFGWTVRAIGFVQLASCLVANLFLKARLPPRRSGSMVEWAAFKELEYTFYAAGMFFNFWGVYFGFYYLASFSRTAVSPPLDYADSLNLLLLVNGIGLVGRLAPNYFADRVGPLNLMVPTCLATGVCLLAWAAVASPAGLYAWAVFYGIAAGGIQSLFPAGLSSLTPDLRRRGTRMGMTFTIVSFATLTGNPIAGLLVSAARGRYWAAQTFTGCCLLVGMGLIFCARVVRQRRNGGGWIFKI